MRSPLTKFVFREMQKTFVCKISSKSNFFFPESLDLLLYLLCRSDTFNETSLVEVDNISQFSLLNGKKE